jgi:hypothetical protein
MMMLPTLPRERSRWLKAIRVESGDQAYSKKSGAMSRGCPPARGTAKSRPWST